MSGALAPPLPREVLSRIYTHLPISSVQNVSKASRALLRTTDKILYAKRVITTPEHVNLFCTVLTDRRSAAGALKELKIQIQADDFYELAETWKRLGRAFRKAPNLKTLRLGGPIPERYLHYLQPCRLDSLVILPTFSIDPITLQDYLCSLHNVKVLSVASSVFSSLRPISPPSPTDIPKPTSNPSSPPSPPPTRVAIPPTPTPTPPFTLSTPAVVLSDSPISRPSLKHFLSVVNLSDAVQIFQLEVEDLGLGVMQTLTLSPSTHRISELVMRGTVRDPYGSSTFLKDLPPILKRLSALQRFTIITPPPFITPTPTIWSLEQSLTTSYSSHLTLLTLTLPSHTTWHSPTLEEYRKGKSLWEPEESGRGEKEWWDANMKDKAWRDNTKRETLSPAETVVATDATDVGFGGNATRARVDVNSDANTTKAEDGSEEEEEHEVESSIGDEDGETSSGSSTTSQSNILVARRRRTLTRTVASPYVFQGRRTRNSATAEESPFAFSASFTSTTTPTRSPFAVGDGDSSSTTASPVNSGAGSSRRSPFAVNNSTNTATATITSTPSPFARPSTSVLSTSSTTSVRT